MSAKVSRFLVIFVVLVPLLAGIAAALLIPRRSVDEGASPDSGPRVEGVVPVPPSPEGHRGAAPRR